jgi:eukaryotic-like serine/threonine-protein kinase
MDSSIMIGRVLDDRYEILKDIDKGGTSIIYRAVDRKTKNIVAVKVLKESLSRDKEYVKRFENEISATLSLEHNNIVHVIDAGHTNDIYYLVMEFIDGRTLKDIIIDKGVINIKEAIDITLSVCSALDHAHSAGFIHRDIKPQNIMIDKTGQVKITDFGIARKMISDEKLKEKKVMGSVQYISPEQVKGEKTDRRSDIYSLGVALFEMITGRLPFAGDTYQAVVLQHINDPMPEPQTFNQNINNALNKIVLKATRKNKRYRYQNAMEFANHLKKVFEKPNGEYIRLAREYKRVSSSEIKRARKRMFFHIAVLSASVLLVAGSLVALVMFGRNSNGRIDELDKTKVPDFIGLSETNVIEMANEYGVQIDRQYGFSNDVAEGLAISQDPSPNDQIILNGDVTVVFSQGVKSINIPNVLNQHVDEAVNVLTSQSLLIGEIEYVESDQPEGYVISQVPEPDQLIPIDEEIKLTVSKIKESSKGVVPDFVGLSIDQVKQSMQDSTFEKCFVYLEQREAALEFDQIKVLDQSPPAESDENVISPIFLWVDAYIDTFHIKKQVEVDIEQPDTPVRVTITNEDSKVELVIHEYKMEKGSHNIDIELISFDAKEEYMRVYLNNELYYEETLESWRRK